MKKIITVKKLKELCWSLGPILFQDQVHKSYTPNNYDGEPIGALCNFYPVQFLLYAETPVGKYGQPTPKLEKILINT